MNGSIAEAIGSQSGLETVFSPQFGVLWLLALLFGIGFAFITWFSRRQKWPPADSGDSVGLVIIGVAGTAFISGFWINWISVIDLMLFFIASGLPMLIESKMAHDQAKKDAIRNQIYEVDHDSTQTLAD
jgi:hypothetical protein